ncbi:conjugal transfer protein TraG N-terminal domain-containing protein, partial [Sphaerochaeta sp.]
MNEFSIYTLGDADSYFYIFNSIAAFIQSNYITFATSIAIMIMMIRGGLAFSNANPKTGTNTVLLMITLYAAALYPSTTAHIIDVRQQGQNKTYTKVDNLPFALVFLASSVSTVVIPLAELTENAFGNLENSATRVGLGKQPEMINNFIKISNFANQESDNFPLSFFKKAFKIYSKECAMSTSYIPDVGLDFFIKPNKDIIEQIDPTTLGIPNSAYTNTTFSDGVVTIQKCTDLYTYLINKRESIETILENKFKEINSGIDYDTYKEDIAKGLYEAGIRVNNIDATLGNYSENLKISMINYALSRTLEETITDYKYDLPGISSDLIDYSVNKSSYQMQIDGLGSLAWVNKMAPLVIHYSLIFSYGLFLFVIPVAMGMGYENSKKVLINYGMGVVAIHLGYISSIIANSISIYYMENSATDLIFETGNNLMAMNSIPSFNTHASEMAAISGILLLSSYFVGSRIILKGEVAAMQGVMNTIGSRFKNDMLNAANDMANKNAYDEVDEKAKTDARRFLNQNGFTTPIGVNEVAYANELKRGLESMGAGYGFASAKENNSSFESDYISGVTNKSVSAATSTATMGANVSTTQAIDSGIVQGSMEAGNMQGLASMVDSVNSVMDGSKKQTMQKTASTASFGDNTSEKEAIDSGNVMGLDSAGKAKGLSKALESSPTFESDYLSGVTNKSASAAVGTATMGANVSIKEAIDSGVVQGSIEAGNMQGLASKVGSANSIMDGSKKQTMQKITSTASFGDNISEEEAINSGNAMGIQSAGKASGLSNALKQIGGEELYDAARTTTIAQTKDQVANANVLTEKFGKDLTGSTNGLSYEEMANAENESKLAGRVGGAKGYK